MTKALLIVAATLGLAGLQPSGASAAPAGCAAHWKVELDKDGFDAIDHRTLMTPAKRAAFRARIEASLKQAIGEACRKGQVKPARAARVRRVIMIDTNGESEAYFYPRSAETLEFYWWSVPGLPVPDRKRVIGGLSCWNDPRSRACAALQEE
jgi:hypothetical protein